MNVPSCFICSKNDHLIDEDDYKDAQRLIRALEKFVELSVDMVPKDSLIREFLGNE